MSDLLATLWHLFALIASLALIAFGGIMPILPAVERYAVHDAHWMTDRDFVNLFAIAQAVPGPNVLVLTLVGLKAAGLPGAAVATLALALPTSALTYAVWMVWDRFRTARWRRAVQAGLVPITLGFIGAAVLVLTRTADTTPVAWGLTLLTIVVTLRTKLNPLWLFAVAAALGAAHLV